MYPHKLLCLPHLHFEKQELIFYIVYADRRRRVLLCNDVHIYTARKRQHKRKHLENHVYHVKRDAILLYTLCG